MFVFPAAAKIREWAAGQVREAGRVRRERGKPLWRIDRELDDGPPRKTTAMQCRRHAGRAWLICAGLVVGPTRADRASRCRRPSPSAGPRRTQRVTLTTYATDAYLAAKSGAGLNSTGCSYETR